MDKDQIRTVVVETMNILEHDYDVDQLVDLGSPTVEEITGRILAEHFTWPGSGQKRSA